MLLNTFDLLGATFIGISVQVYWLLTLLHIRFKRCLFRKVTFLLLPLLLNLFIPIFGPLCHPFVSVLGCLSWRFWGITSFDLAAYQIRFEGALGQFFFLSGLDWIYSFVVTLFLQILIHFMQVVPNILFFLKRLYRTSGMLRIFSTQIFQIFICCVSTFLCELIA